MTVTDIRYVMTSEYKWIIEKDEKIVAMSEYDGCLVALTLWMNVSHCQNIALLNFCCYIVSTIYED